MAMSHVDEPRVPRGPASRIAPRGTTQRPTRAPTGPRARVPARSGNTRAYRK